MKKVMSFLMIAALFAFVLAGCQPAPAAPEAAPAAEEAPAEEAPAEAAPVEEVDVTKALIGIILPAKQESRWLGDEAKFLKLIEEKGYNAEILFSQNSSAIEKTNVETFIAKGAKVIILCPFDATAAAAAVKDAEDAGIPVISYDRLILDSEFIDAYVTFDSIAVGAAQATYLVEQAGNTKGNNLYMYSGALTDNNSFLFFEGAWNVLRPKIADGTFIVRNAPKAVEYMDKAVLTRDEKADIMSTIDTEWSMEVSKSLAEAHLTANDASAKGLVYVLGPADDDCSRSLSDTFYADAEIDKIFIAGADGVKASVQYIIDGKQNMTVYKNPNELVLASMAIAEAWLKGEEFVFDKTYNNNKIDVPSVQADVTTVTAENIVEIFFDGGVYDGSEFTNWEK